MTQVEWNGMKNAIMQVTYCWNGPMTVCFFIVIFLYIKSELRVTFKRDLALILPLNSKLSRIFQHFNGIDRSIEMLRNS